MSADIPHRTASQVNEFCHYATRTELDYLRTLASALPAGIQVVMLGAGPGVMAMAVLEGNPGVQMVVIDHDTTQWAQKHIGPGYAVGFLEADSAEMGRVWAGQAVSLLIIDADHSYEGVKRDCGAWLSRVARGGYVFFHDYDASETEFAGQEQYPGVRQAVEEMLDYGEWREQARAGTAIIFRRYE